MGLVDNEMDLSIMDWFLEVEDDIFREFVDDFRGDIRKKVLNCAVKGVGGALIELREELMDVFCCLLALVDDVRILLFSD